MKFDEVYNYCYFSNDKKLVILNITSQSLSNKINNDCPLCQIQPNIMEIMLTYTQMLMSNLFIAQRKVLTYIRICSGYQKLKIQTRVISINQALARKFINHQQIMEKLWSDSVQLGKLILKNRVVMSALTRVRCELDGIPTDLVAEYYGQRAGAGLILTESAAISQIGYGFPGQGNIFNKEQAEGWKKVIHGVHQKNTKIICQVFHAGRVTHPLFNGQSETWAPSAVQSREKVKELGGVDYPLPKAVTKDDIETLKREYDNAFSLAKEAGFDGIQLHGAFGYLIDEFLRSFTNRRTDEYGGSAQNRARFPLEVIDIALKHFEPSQIGMKLSPTSRIQDMFDENPVETYGHLLKELSKRGIGFVELAESKNEHSYGGRVYHIPPTDQIQDVCKTFRPFFNGIIIGNYGFNPESGLKAIREGHCDLISFGKDYIAHPDLAERIINGWELDNKLDFTTLYTNKEKGKVAGYTDYPFYKAKI